MTESTIKSIGFIGCGETARFHAEVLNNLNIKISCVFALNQKSKNIEGFANDFHIEKKYFDIDQMLSNEKLDAVWVVVPWNITYKVLKQIRKYDLPIFVEKPVATTKAQIEKLIDLYKDFDHHLQVGYNRRFYDFISQLKEDLMNQEIKSVIIEAPESSSEEDIFNQNMIHINTSHLIDLVLYLFDSLEFKNSWKTDKKNYTAFLLAQKNIPVHFISSWDTNSNFSIKISGKDKVFHLQPIEKLSIYDSMKVTTFSEENKIRSYIPNIQSEH
jgi:predicted dehydrogenase